MSEVPHLDTKEYARIHTQALDDEEQAHCTWSQLVIAAATEGSDKLVVL